jgi:hypothetical protein
MLHTDQRKQLRVKIETKQCELPRDELPRIDKPLNKLADILGDLPGALDITIVNHPKSQQFHVRAALGLPRHSLFTGDWDPYLDTALCRAIRKLIHKADDYQHEPDGAADEVAQRVSRLQRDIVAPEDPDVGELGAAAASGDYRRFRDLLAGYEDWLRLRVGRWLKRYPRAEAELGRRIKIGDLLEEVFLNAFERYGERTAVVSLHQWLDSLLDPSLQAFFRQPVEERENVSMVRSLRTPPAAIRSPTMKTATKKKQSKSRKWSGKIHTVATFPPEGTFKKDAKSVARIMASEKVSPKGIGSGIRMISMYINRAGKNLDSKQKKELEEAKHILQEKMNGKAGRRGTKSTRPAASRTSKGASSRKKPRKTAAKRKSMTPTKKAKSGVKSRKKSASR